MVTSTFVAPTARTIVNVEWEYSSGHRVWRRFTGINAHAAAAAYMTAMETSDPDGSLSDLEDYEDEGEG